MAADTGGVGVSDPGLLGNPSSLRVDTVRGLSGAHDNEPNVHYWPCVTSTAGPNGVA
jgi:hypothetical protein